MTNKMACALLLGAVALTGCTTGPEPAPTTAVSRADTMWQGRTVDFTAPATLLLGTTANLDRVEVTSGIDRYALTSAQASAKLGFDVKELGRNEDTLLAYLRSLGV